MSGEHRALQLAEAIAARLADPATVPGPAPTQDWWAQSLAHGAPGITLLHLELAATGRGPWQRAHDWLGYLAQAPITVGPDSHPFHGAPAIAHVLACAAQITPAPYQGAMHTLDARIHADIRRRVDAAHARIDTGHPGQMHEFDVLRGLTGSGAYLLRRDPTSPLLRAVLNYLVRLSTPITTDDGRERPGWWTAMAPTGRPDPARFPTGHANAGIAHGIAGPLCLLALALRAEIRVPGHVEAIHRICVWLDQHRTDTPAGPRWPYWVTRPDPTPTVVGSGAPVLRPSWCYGTAGLARAQQLAALATGDTARQDLAEDALILALHDPAQRAATTGACLCHGHAGLAHLSARTAADATPTAAARLRALIPGLLDVVQPAGTDPHQAATDLLALPGTGPDQAGPGLLEGAAGIALAALAPATSVLPQTGWDTCLLLT